MLPQHGTLRIHFFFFFLSPFPRFFFPHCCCSVCKERGSHSAVLLALFVARALSLSLSTLCHCSVLLSLFPHYATVLSFSLSPHYATVLSFSLSFHTFVEFSLRSHSCSCTRRAYSAYSPPFAAMPVRAQGVRTARTGLPFSVPVWFCLRPPFYISFVFSAPLMYVRNVSDITC